MSDCISLNGVWRFLTDPDNIGIEQQYFQQENQPYLENKTRLIVPGCWNRDSQVELSEYQGIVWYFRTFNIPERFQGKQVKMKFGGIIHSAIIYIDGQQVHSFAGAFMPFDFDITSFVDNKPHFIAIRIDNLSDKITYYGPNPSKLYGGIIGNIDICAIEPLVLEEFTVSMKILNGKDFELDILIGVHNYANSDFNGTMTFNLSKDFIPIQSLDRDINVLKQNSRMAKVKWTIDAPEFWTLDDPTLYNLQFTINDKQKTWIRFDEIIGFREIFVSEKEIKVNGKPIQIKGRKFDLAHPEFGFFMPDSVIFDRLAYIKKQGYTIIRPKFGLFNSAVIEACSRLGLLVIQDLPIINEREEFFRIMVESMKNYPALIEYSINPTIDLTHPEHSKTYVELQKLFLSRLDGSRTMISSNFATDESWD